MVVVAFILSVLLALIIGFIIGITLAAYEEVKNEENTEKIDLSKMTDEEIRAKYFL